MMGWSLQVHHIFATKKNPSYFPFYWFFKIYWYPHKLGSFSSPRNSLNNRSTGPQDHIFHILLDFEPRFLKVFPAAFFGKKMARKALGCWMISAHKGWNVRRKMTCKSARPQENIYSNRCWMWKCLLLFMADCLMPTIWTESLQQHSTVKALSSLVQIWRRSNFDKKSVGLWFRAKVENTDVASYKKGPP